MDNLRPVSILHQVIMLNEAASINEDRSEAHKCKSTETGITISKSTPSCPPKLTKEISSLISHPEFLDYQLSRQDVVCIALLWKKHLESIGTRTAWNALCADLGMDIYDTISCLEYIESLVDRKIISFDEMIKSDYHINPIILLAGEYLLNNELILKILGRNIPFEIDKLISSNWASDAELIADLKQCLNTIFDCFGEPDGYYRNRGKSIDPDIFSRCFEPFLDRLDQSESQLMISKIISDNKLNKQETCMLLLVLYTQLTQDECICEQDLLSFLCKSSSDTSLYSGYLAQDGKLMCILEAKACTGFVNMTELAVPNELMKQLCGETESNRKQNLEYYLKQHGALQLVKAEQSIADLILPERDKNLLESLTRRYHQSKSSESADCGFETSIPKGLIALFYGSPGTGKTFAAGAVANALGKSLVALDCSALRSSYYGESEKLVKSAFTLMQTMSEEMDNPPVFLINEADQIIHNRIERNNFSSRTDNSIQSIILEALESFSGILILTTNLETGIDEAYFRRFHLKLSFYPPDCEARIKLWKLHLREEIPGAADLDLNYLARTYCFTGGQIALVVHNAYSEAISRQDEMKRLTMNDIIKYACLELPWAGNTSKNVGF